MAWLLVLLAGTIEIAWAQSLRLSEGFSRLIPSVAAFILTIALVYTLALAMQGLPSGTVYVVFTGMGAIGTSLIGIVWLGEAFSLGRLLALLAIISGVLALYVIE